MTKEQRQQYINDHCDTMAQIIANRFCLRKEAVIRWLNSKGYTEDDFGKVIALINKSFESWLTEVIWA